MIFDNEDSGNTPRAKKRFGQHFLIDRNVINRIIKTADLSESDHVVEVGPGLGALTEGLVESGASVTAVEVDTDLAEVLKEKFKGAGNFEIIIKDALKFSFDDFAVEKGRKLKLVSNLPYNISGPILAKFLSERSAFTLMVLMFQKEVAERIAAGPGTKDYGILSVFSQMFTDVRLEFHVSRNLFTPRPKVESSVVSFKVLDTPRYEITNEAFFKTVVKSAFGTRRKTLLNALKALGLEKEIILQGLNKAEIDPQRRGETLTGAEFSRLANILFLLKA
ncbi:MAG: ribosomal RNA small subunit methyltransferase A [Deltaproteobacteria bacterium]|nr:ribosomal RNA small subunit methyltransferase A [Deltaproteobacteria bacterium]